MNFEVEGIRPVGRPKKTWRKGVEEDMGELCINEEMARDRNQWRRLISRQPHSIGKYLSLSSTPLRLL